MVLKEISNSHADACTKMFIFIKDENLSKTNIDHFLSTMKLKNKISSKI